MKRFAWLLLLPVLIAAKCGAVPVAATPGGVTVYTGVHPPAENAPGVWERPTGSNIWKYVAWGAAGAALGRGAHIVMSEGGTRNEADPGRVVVIDHMTTEEKAGHQSYNQLCGGDLNNKLLVTWVMRTKRLNFLCTSWKFATRKTYPLPKVTLCISRMLTQIISVRSGWDSIFGEKVTTWDTKLGEIITDNKGDILRANLRISNAWESCSAGL